MRALACLLSVLQLSLNGLLTAPLPAPPPSENLCLFLSLRMKGNGDGTITAIAQNEFSIGNPVFPVCLRLYVSDVNTSDVSQMQLIDSVREDDLEAFRSVAVTYELTKAAYYCAVVEYYVNSEAKTQQCNTIYYDLNGNRA